MVPSACRHRDAPPMAQHRRRLVLREGLRPQGAPLSSVQVQPQTGGDQTRLVPTVHAHGLPGQGEQGHPRPPGRRPGRGLDASRHRAHEPPSGRGGDSQEGAGLLPRRRRLRRRRHGVRDTPRRREGRPGPHRRVGLLHRRHRHSSGPRDLHGGQRPLRGSTHLPGSVQGRDAADRMLVQVGRGPQNKSRRAKSTGKDEGIQGRPGTGDVLGEGPPALPIRWSGST